MRSLDRLGVAVLSVVAAIGVSACDTVQVPGLNASTQVAALNLDYDPDTLRVAAGKRFVIHFRNADPAGMLHTVAIRGPNAVTVLQDQAAIDGQTEIDYAYDPLPPGDYVFICSVHPIITMTGVLQVR